MKLLLKILAGLTAVVLLLVVVAFFLPRQYRVERAIEIRARPEAVFAQVADLQAWKNWGVWYDRDPKMQNTYSKPSTGVGAWSSWQSATEGNGKATLTHVAPPLRAVYTLEFPDMGMKSTGTFALTPTAAGVRLVWSDEGDLGMNPMSRWFGLFLDRMIGPDFEAGLQKMKLLLEVK